MDDHIFQTSLTIAGLLKQHVNFEDHKNNQKRRANQRRTKEDFLHFGSYVDLEMVNEVGAGRGTW